MVIQNWIRSKIQIIHLGVGEKIQYKTPNASLTLKYVIEGEENLVINDQHKHKIKEGQFLLINGGRQVTSMHTPRGGMGLSIFISQELIQEVLAAQGGRVEDGRRNFKRSINLEELVWETELTQLSDALKEIQNKVEVDSDPAPQCLEYLIPDLIRRLNVHAQHESKAIRRIKAAKLVTRQEIYKRIHATREYMNENFTRVITLDELADVAHISKYHFLRLFTSIYCVTPSKYLQDLRFQRAYEMLKSHQYTVTEVAMFFKFNDLSYFSNRFKNYFGFRPSELLMNESPQ